MRKLQTEYIDLCLIHQPFNDYYGTYRAMDVGRILRTFKIKKNVEVTDNGKIII